VKKMSDREAIRLCSRWRWHLVDTPPEYRRVLSLARKCLLIRKERDDLQARLSAIVKHATRQYYKGRSDEREEQRTGRKATR